MKTKLLIFSMPWIILLSWFGAEQAYGLCTPDMLKDWPDIPCGPTELPQDELRDHWQGYYEFKGKEWMEAKKKEMEEAILAGRLDSWKTNISNWNVWVYYKITNHTPDASPLKQFLSGIPIDEIQCGEGMILIIKSSDGSPACVTPDTKQKLIERGWTTQDSQDRKTTTPYCRDPLYVLDPDTNKCITNEELPKCTGNTAYNDTIRHCRVSVTCDKEFDPDTMGSDVSALPQCKPLRECPDGFLVAIFPVNGDDALCEREDRKILSGVYYSYEQRMLTTSGVDAKENDSPSKPINLNGTKEQRTIQISVITSGWYEKLGNPRVVIESNGNQIEQFALDLKNNKPGQTTHGVEYVLSEDLPDGTITIHIDMPGYDLLKPQSFSVKHISD